MRLRIKSLMIATVAAGVILGEYRYLQRATRPDRILNFPSSRMLIRLIAYVGVLALLGRWLGDSICVPEETECGRAGGRTPEEGATPGP